MTAIIIALLAFAAGIAVGDRLCRRALKPALRFHQSVISDCEDIRLYRKLVGTGLSLSRKTTFEISRLGRFDIEISDIEPSDELDRIQS